MFTVALVTTAKKWKRLKCPSMMDTQNEIYPYNEILFSLKKKENDHSYYNIHESRGHATNKRVPKGPICTLPLP